VGELHAIVAAHGAQSPAEIRAAADLDGYGDGRRNNGAEDERQHVFL
jgi:hypothetical protein